MIKRIIVSLFILIILSSIGNASFLPLDPINLTNITDNFWINHTWNPNENANKYGWHLISGNIDGVFYGFNKTGGIWQQDAVINNSLPDVGSGSQPTVFKKNGTWYLISGYNSGGFYGFDWTGSGWQSNSTIVGGLGIVQYWSAPTVFEKDGVWYLISGSDNGNFYGFNWTGSSWQSDNVIASGLPDIGGDSVPTVFEKDGIWYLISGDVTGVFNGYNWTGSTWQSESEIISGLDDVGWYSTPTVFEKDGIWYLVSGEDTAGAFNGYNWTGSTWQSDDEIVNGLGSVGTRTTVTIFNFGGTTDSYNVTVNSVWHNTTNTFYNDTYSAHAWQNITVWAYNSSGTGTLSSGSVDQDTQIPNNPITITNTSDWSGDKGENVYVDYDATDADSDTPTFSCNRTDLFTDFSAVTGEGNWTTDYTVEGVYYADFGVSDDYGSTSNYTMTITVASFGMTPPIPTSLTNTTGNFWVNHTWAAGSGNVTDGYNVSVNTIWHNTTNTFYTDTYSANAWQNITVWAYNSSCTGTMSEGNVSQNTQVPSTPVIVMVSQLKDIFAAIILTVKAIFNLIIDVFPFIIAMIFLSSFAYLIGKVFGRRR